MSSQERFILAMRLNLDRDHVAVLDYVVAAPDAERALAGGGRVAAALAQLPPADRFGLDEGVLDLGVDRARRLPGGRAARDRARNRLLALAGGEEGEQVEQVVGSTDEAGGGPAPHPPRLRAPPPLWRGRGRRGRPPPGRARR